MWVSDKWKDYEILEAVNGEKLERFGEYLLIRPDPQIIFDTKKSNNWKNVNAHYHRSKSGGGAWDIKDLPEIFYINYEIDNKNLRFQLQPFGFKHTGIFPEQATNWEFSYNKIKNSGRDIKVLNLFGYTGGATVSAALAGASVVHVDASKGMVTIAKENARLSNLENANIRYIVDDCSKFVSREIRRGNKYDAIIMDPPSFGRGPKGEPWKIEEQISNFIELVVQVLSDNPLFIIINSYTTGLSPYVMQYILQEKLKNIGFSCKCESNELGLVVKSNGYYLPQGGTTRCEF